MIARPELLKLRELPDLREMLVVAVWEQVRVAVVEAAVRDLEPEVARADIVYVLIADIGSPIDAVSPVLRLDARNVTQQWSEKDNIADI